MDRYSNRPFLRLLDCYLLDVLSALPDQQRRGLIAMEARLRETFNRAGSWQQVVAGEMQLHAEFVPWLKARWEVEVARTPAADMLVFVHQIADELAGEAPSTEA